MMKSFISAVFAVFVATTSASAYAAQPGSYAQNSKVYQDYIRVCHRSAVGYSSDNPRAQMLEDEAARRIEKMSAAERAQQIKGCQAGLPPEMRQAANLPPAAYVGAGAVAGAIVGRNLGHRRSVHEGFSAAQEEQLDELLDRKSEQLLGERASNSIGFQPSEGGPAIHCRGGHIIKGVKANGGTFSRVFCPGTRPRGY